MSTYRSRLLLNEPDRKEYTFLSRGINGTFRKVVELERYPGTDIFNVLLVDEVAGFRRSDEDLTGNHDALKVVNTVVRIIEKFLAAFPEAGVFVSGNTPVKKAFYQRKVYGMKEAKYTVLANRVDGEAFAPVERPVNSGPVYNAFLVFPA